MINSYPVLFQNKILKKELVKFNFYSPCVQYGIHVFEGLLNLNINNSNYIFRLRDHIIRLVNSCNRLSIEIPIDLDCIIHSVKVYINEIKPNSDCMIRVSIFPLEGSWSSKSLKGELLISAFENSTSTLSNNLNQLSLLITKIKKPSKDCLDQTIKVGANYLNSRYAHLESISQGYDTCLLCNDDLLITESGGSNIFFVNDDSLITPSLSSNILEGVTRDTIIFIANKLKLDIKCKDIYKDDLSKFKASFLCGTSMRIKPIVKINNINYDANNTITNQVIQAYNNILYNPNMTNNIWHTRI